MQRTIKVGEFVNIVLNSNGTVDEIFVSNGKECVFHLEQMSGNHYWAVANDPANEKELHMDFGSVSPIEVNLRTDEPE